MMKTYKHKTLGLTSAGEVLYTGEGKPQLRLLIQDSSDREEVIENGWIDNCVEELKRTSAKLLWEENYFKKIIEQHAPKQKQFSEKDIDEWVKENMLSKGTTISFLEFLKEHGLLSSSDE